MSEHTKEPWLQYGTAVFLSNNSGGFDLRFCPDAQANARRIVACVNACEGIPTEVLESGSHRIIQRYAAAERQRDELLAELKSAIEHIDFKHEAYASAYELITKIEASHEP